MKRTILFLAILLLLFTPVLIMAEEPSTDEAVTETGQMDAGIIVPQEQVISDGDSEEVQIEAPKAKIVHKFTDVRILAIESEAQEKIQAIVEEINQLADKSDEGELQKEVERIKLDAEIARLRIQMEDAEDAQNFDIADEIRDEIDHLENLDKPSIGIPKEQPAAL